MCAPGIETDDARNNEQNGRDFECGKWFFITDQREAA
jgi:hypothetical protein